MVVRSAKIADGGSATGEAGDADDEEVELVFEHVAFGEDAVAPPRAPLSHTARELFEQRTATTREEAQLGAQIVGDVPALRRGAKRRCLAQECTAELGRKR